jgi:FKBP-type peptidyl-prolyl cis-trans isomerase FkpA
MSRLRTALLLALTLSLGACLEGSPFVPNIENTNFAPELGVNLASSVKTASGLYYRDIVVGTGDSVRSGTSGDTVFVRYSGFLRNGVKFDDNQAAPQPFRFVVGRAEVIAGFEEGVRGMKVSGQRQLIIPPSLGYGNRGVGNIPANSILVFTITLTRVGAPAPAP